MNVTLSIDEDLLARGRALASGRGKSLNQLIRDLLAAETGIGDGPLLAAAMDALWARESATPAVARSVAKTPTTPA